MADVVVLITLRFPDPLIQRIRAVSPQLRVEVHPATTSAELPGTLLPDVEILYTLRALPDPESVPSLRWIQFHYAGVDHVADHPLLRGGVEITTLSGAAVAQMAEFVMMGILGLGRRLPRLERDRADKRWAENRFDRFRPLDVEGSTVGIVGYGSIGREVARLCRAFGARILATKRDLRHPGDTGYSVEGRGDPGSELPDRMYPPQALGSMAAESDFLVVTVPLTPETRGMIEALSEKRLGGAALDVFPIEPLPATSPLWEMPNVILSPHIAGSSARYFEQATALFVLNLQRYLTDQPLLNRYDPQRGY